MTVAALYVEHGGVYYGLDGVEPWGLPERDAMEYEGPWPVVAHPPCTRWSKLAHIHQAAGRFTVGDDGGCFRHALEAVRTYGGVLEHPEGTAAWAAFTLPRPALGLWQRSICGGWVATVDQLAYGHRAQKRTWLYAFGCSSLPVIQLPSAEAEMTVEFMGRDERRRTPPPFRDFLVDVASRCAAVDAVG